MSKRTSAPVALTIASSDSGGGAGVQADLKTWAALGVHGTTAIACVTAQNPKAVSGIQPVKAEMVRRQIAAVFAELAPAAVKTGMLYSAEIIRTAADVLRRRKQVPLIVDPVAVATSGARLLKPSAIAALRSELLPLASLVTPNLAEVEMIFRFRIESEEDMRAAARLIHKEFGCAALIKGGHLRHTQQAADIFYDGQNELLLAAPYIRGVTTHGTGCTYSAAITAYCARGCGLPEAVAKAKDYITQAIAQSRTVGAHTVLNWFWTK